MGWDGKGRTRWWRAWGTEREHRRARQRGEEGCMVEEARVMMMKKKRTMWWWFEAQFLMIPNLQLLLPPLFLCLSWPREGGREMRRKEWKGGCWGRKLDHFYLINLVACQPARSPCYLINKIIIGCFLN